MKFINQRLFDNGQYTIGFVQAEDRKFHSFALEDIHREVKIPKETRIPSGFYELKIRKEDTPLTIKHRAAYGSWFKYHIEITNVPQYQGVYIHAGNDDSHTEGCLLLGYGFDLSLDKMQQFKSTVAVKDFYAIAYPLLEAGQKVFIEVRDEIK